MANATSTATASLRKVIALFRAARMALHIAYGMLIALIYPRFSESVRQRILRRWSAELIHILNVRIVIPHDDAMHTQPAGIIVSNHISWLDVIVLNAVIPLRFVAKSEVRSWPVIGWLCMRAQTLFIERGRARDAARINRQLVELLQDGGSLAVFPEGTTTDGRQVGDFHASLLQPAVDAGSQIHPVAIRYQDAHGAHSIAAAYIDELSFGESLWTLLNCRSLHVRLVATPSLEALGSDRRTLTRIAQQQIRTAVEQMHADFPPLTILEC